MPSVVDEEECVLRFMCLDELADTHHQLQMGIFRRNGKDVGPEGKVFAQAFFQVLQLWQYEEIV